MASDALKQNNEGFKNGTKREVVSTSVVIEIVFTCERVKRCASGRGSLLKCFFDVLNEN
jgi:hypothetical protein